MNTSPPGANDFGAPAPLEERPRRASRQAIVFDDVHWPLLVVRFHGTASDHELELYLEQLSRILGRRERHAIVLDATEAHFTPTPHWRRQAEWLRAHREELAELCAGTAFVFSSRLFRLVIAGVFMLQPMPGPYGIFTMPNEGICWAAERLGIEPPVPQLVWDKEATTNRILKP